MNRREALQKTALLLGYAVSAPAIVGILKGCKATPELTYVPVFFTPEQAVTMGELVQIIIPATDTPGAKEAGVPAFIDQILWECYSEEEQDRFLKGLADFEQAVLQATGKSFQSCSPDQQVEVFAQQHEAAVQAVRSGNGNPRPFLLTVKELTLLGFFTSEPGATQVLQYEAVPGRYNGCIPLAEVGRAWASS